MERGINGPEQELLSPEEAARWLGVPKTTFLDLVRDGRIPPPQRVNQAVQFYSWEVVYAMRVLLGQGFLPLPELPERPRERPSGAG